MSAACGLPLGAEIDRLLAVNAALLEALRVIEHMADYDESGIGRVAHAAISTAEAAGVKLEHE